MSEHFAHSGTSDDRSDWHPLPDHLTAVARLAQDRASALGLGRIAYLAGLYHDLGKYDPAFDGRLMGKPGRVDHSTAGAAVLLADAPPAEQVVREMVAYAILGHHAGLPDFSSSEPSCLKQRVEGFRDKLDPVWKDQIPGPAQDLAQDLRLLLSRCSKETAEFDFALLTRLLFSCLVDADFRDTEAFYSAIEGRQPDRTWSALSDILPDLTAAFDSHMAQKAADAKPSDLNRLRGDVLSQVRAKAALPPGLFTLTVPTGGGKTLASLGFALDHARLHGLRRIIYAIPFTSIIDQTATIFREVLGDDAVLEHHSAIEESRQDTRDQPPEGKDKLRLAMEDWAAPVIVTTNVQFFESLFAARPGRTRKLHNIAGSVIILDEAQTIPRALLLPCLRTLDALARLMGCSIVLCTATQPAVDQEQLKGGLPLARRELAPDPQRLAARLRRTRIDHGGPMDNAALVAALGGVKQGLMIVNSRAHALDLWKEAEGLEGLFHLTTRQYAAHRRRVLTEIRERLKTGLPCRLIATSLIEAGVDISFPRGWRAEAGLDQIVQAAGRVNRNGEMLPDLGQVTVFAPVGYDPPSEIKGLIGDMARMRGRHDDLLSLDAIKAYFAEVYWRMDADLDQKKILASFRLGRNGTDFAFRTVAERFRMIESGLAPVIVPRDTDAQEVVRQLGIKAISSGRLARGLQIHIVQVPPKARDRLRACGKGGFVHPDLRGDQFFVLEAPDLYTEATGLRWEDAEYLGADQAVI